MYRSFVLATLMLVNQLLFGYTKRDWHCLSRVAKSTLTKLHWTRAALIHDNESAAIIKHLEGIQLIVYRVNTGIPVTQVLHEIHDKLFPEMNVVVALQTMNLLTKFLHEVDGLDNRRNHSTDWSHHSKWLLFSPTLPGVQLAGLHFKNIQNVAILSQKYETCTDESQAITFKLDVKGFQPVNTKIFPFGLFPNTKYRYNGRLLRVSTIESHPFVIGEETVAADHIPYTGYCIEVLRTIAKHLNLTLKYVEPRDGIWGWIDDGMMGQLRRREIDLVASEMIVHVKRAQHMDYITPYLYSDELILLYKMPQGREPIFLLARPFQVFVYMTYMAAMFGVIMTLALIRHLTMSTSATPGNQTWLLCWDVIRSSLRQGDTLRCGTFPDRILLASWLMVVMIMSSLYCGNLTASLATSSRLTRFNNIDELVDSDFSVGFIPGGIIGQMLENSSHNSVKRLSQRITSRNATDPWITSSSTEDHIKRVKNGNYAFLTYSLYVDSLANSNCNLTKLRVGSVAQEQTAFVVQKDSPFKEDINVVMHRLRSTGILDKLWQKWTNQTKAIRECHGEQKNVTVSELSGGIILVSAGIGLASIVFLLECLKTEHVQE